MREIWNRAKFEPFTFLMQQTTSTVIGEIKMFREGRQVHRDKEKSLILIGTLLTAHTPLSCTSLQVNALSFDSPRLLPEPPRLEKGRKSRALCLRIHVLRAYIDVIHGAQRETEKDRERERERETGDKGSERICRSEWIRGYGSTNKVITRTQTAGTMVSREIEVDPSDTAEFERIMKNFLQKYYRSFFRDEDIIISISYHNIAYIERSRRPSFRQRDEKAKRAHHKVCFPYSNHFSLFLARRPRHPFKALVTSERCDCFHSFHIFPCIEATGETTDCPTFIIAEAISIGRSDAHTLCKSCSPR
ncbi:hypothetical protein ALC53_11164 [Atta colombica]|uniref:Uncharacterized protein n=1 Tax=Atta colombica TaxID=520822 RepID=A0A195B2T4_9HYME|nr:hypothetical protein ALC53_11164 [Atta colombica]